MKIKSKIGGLVRFFKLYLKNAYTKKRDSNNLKYQAINL